MKALMTLLVLLLVAAPTAGMAQTNDGVPVIAPEMEKVIQQMLGTNLPAGWRLERAQIQQAAIQVSYSGPKEALAKLTLTHASDPQAAGAAAVGPFAWVSDPKAPLKGALEAAVKKGIKGKAKAFKWATTPHGPLDPAAAAAGNEPEARDRTATPAPSRPGWTGVGPAPGGAAAAAPAPMAPGQAPRGAPAPQGAQGTPAAAGAPTAPMAAGAPGGAAQGQAMAVVPAHVTPPDPLALSQDEQNLVREVEALRTICSAVADDKTRGAAILKAVESKDTHPWAIVVAAAGLNEVKDHEGAEALYKRALDEVESRMAKLTGAESTIALRTRIAALFGTGQKVVGIAALKDALNDEMAASSPVAAPGAPAAPQAAAPGAAGAGAGAGAGAVTMPAGAAAAAARPGQCGTDYSLGDVLGTSAFIAVIAFAGAALVRRRRED